MKKSITKSITSLAFLLIRPILSTNLLTKFPKNLIIAAEDKIGFYSHEFINGSQIEQQVYPTPFIQEFEQDKIVSHIKINLRSIPYMSGCKFTVSKFPLKYITICFGSQVVYHTHRQNMTIEKIQSLNIGRGYRCDDAEIKGELFFVSCLTVPNQSGFSNLELNVLKPSETGTALILVQKISYENFFNPRADKADRFALTEIAVVQTSPTLYKMLAYQAKTSTNTLLTSKKVLVVQFDSKTKVISTIAKKDNLIKKSINRGYFVNGDWFYAQVKGEASLVSCQVKAKDIVCDENNLFSFGGTEQLAIWAIDHNYEVKKSTIFLANKKKFSKCNIKNLPLDMDKLKKNCEVIDLIFSAKQKGEIRDVKGIVSGKLYASNNLNDLIISYHHYGDSSVAQSKQVAGYLKVDIPGKRTSFKALDGLQADEINLINSTHYTLVLGDNLPMFKTSPHKFVIRPPKKASSAKIYLSSLDTIKKNAQQSSKPFVISTTVTRLENEFKNLTMRPIGKFSVYNQKGLQRLGVNAKIMQGNNADVEVNIIKNIIPLKKQSVNKLNFTLPELDDSDVKDLLLSSDGAFIMLNEHDQLRITICDITIDLVQNIECKKVYEKKQQGVKIQKALREGINLFLIKRQLNKDSTVNMVLQKLVGKIEKSKDGKIKYELGDAGIATVSKFDAFCDVKMFGEAVLTICSNNGPSKEKNKQEIIVNKLIFKRDGSLESQDSFKINPYDYGNYGFKKGEVYFRGGSVMAAIAVNNDPTDLSILELEFNRIDEKVPISIVGKYPINSKLKIKDNQPTYNVQICLMLKSIFFFEKQTGKIYGANIDTISESYLEVPINGEDRKVKSILCSPEKESFQLEVQETTTNTRYLLTYYGFDGTQANKKLHSEHKIPLRLDHMAMTCVIEGRDGILLTYMYDESSLFYNETIMVDLRGPIIYGNFEGMVPGDYPYEVTLKNKKTKAKFKGELRVLKPALLEPIVRADSPTKVIASRKLSDYFTIKGPLYYSQIQDEEMKKKFTIEQRIKKISDLELEDKHTLIGVDNGITLIKDDSNNILKIYFTYKKGGKASAVVKASTYGKNFGHIRLSVRKKDIYVITTVVSGIRTKIIVNYMLKKEGTRIHELMNTEAPFDVDAMEISSGENSISIAVREKGGNKIIIYRETKNIETINLKAVTYQWRQPGDNSLFSNSKFQISHVQGVDILTVISVGTRKIQMFTLNFLRGSIENSLEINDFNKPFSFLSCYSAHDSVDLLCIIGGLGVEFSSIVVKVEPEGLRISRVKKDPRIKNFVFPPLQKRKINDVMNLKDYVIFTGEFGTLNIKDEKGKFMSGKEIEKKSEGTLPQEVNALVFKLDQKEIYAVPKGQVIFADEDEKKTPYLLQKINSKYTMSGIGPFVIKAKFLKAGPVQQGPSALVLDMFGPSVLKVKFSTKNRKDDFFSSSVIILLIFFVCFAIVIVSTLMLCIANSVSGKERKRRRERGEELVEKVDLKAIKEEDEEDSLDDENRSDDDVDDYEIELNDDDRL